MAAAPSTSTPLDRHTSPVADTERRTGRAVASLVLGIISIPTFFFWPVAITLGVLAIVIGTMARTDARKLGYVNTGQAKAGVICGIAGIVLAVGFIVVIAIAAN